MAVSRYMWLVEYMQLKLTRDVQILEDFLSEVLVCFI